MFTADDYLFFVAEALDAMVDIVRELGDPRAGRRPDLPGANSPYALLIHCLGVMEFWGGHVVAGRTINRDRDAEFSSSGTVEEAVELAYEARLRLAADLEDFVPLAAPRGRVDPADAALPVGATQAGALLHLYSELAQHRGQMEGCRDLLLSSWVRLADEPTAEPQSDSRYRP